MEWVESTGRSIDDAKEAALDRLGVHEDEAEFDVLTEAKVGLFGRVKEDARVRARVRPAAPRAKEQRRRGRGRDRASSSGGDGRGSGRSGRSKNSKSGAGSRRDEGGRKSRPESKSRNRPRSDGPGKGHDRSEEPKRDRKKGSESRARSKVEESPVSDDYDEGPSLEEQATLAEEFVGGLAEQFGKTLTFERDELEDEILRIEAAGDDIGILVGRKGSTAQAIDDLVRTVLQRAGGTTREGKIRVDIGGVKARRAAALTEFSRRIASDVIETGAEIALEPMGGADRKLVHDVVGEVDGVETRSEGEDPYRRVVIVPVSGEI